MYLDLITVRQFH